MVTFDSNTLPRILTVSRGNIKNLSDLGIVDADYSQIDDKGGRGEIINVSGRIDWTDSLPTVQVTIHDLLRSSATLDLEDGSDTMTAIFTRLSFRRDVNFPRQLFYTATFLEKDNPT